VSDDFMLLADADTDEVIGVEIERRHVVIQDRDYYRLPPWWPWVWASVAVALWIVFATWIGFPTLVTAGGAVALVLLRLRTSRRLP